MNVNFNAYHFVDSEKALELPDSAGKKKSRLHLYDFNGLEGKDRYAVAAEKLTVAKDETPSLGWLDRKFYVLHAHKEGDTTTWYKINKNSLQKRLDFSPKMMKMLVDENTGIAQGLDDLLDDKMKKQPLIGAWQMKCATPNFPSQKFIEKLVDAGIPAAPFKAVVFCTRPDTQVFGQGGTTDLYLGNDSDHDPNNIRHFTPGSLLVVTSSFVVTDMYSFIYAQPPEVQNFLSQNKDLLTFVRLPVSEEEFDKELLSDNPIDAEVLAEINVQDTLIQKLEEQCKGSLWSHHNVNPTKARVVLFNGTNFTAVEIPPEKDNFPDLKQAAKDLVSDDEVPYFPGEAEAIIIAKYDNKDHWMIITLKNGKTQPFWFKGFPSTKVAFKNVGTDVLSQIFDDFN